MSASSASVLRRKIAGRAPAPPAMTAEKALRLAVAQAADRSLGVAASAEALVVKSGPAEAVVADLPDPGLILRLAGPSGRTGLFSLDADGLSAVVEAATLGRLSASAPVTRKSTAVDAALSADFVNGLLSGLAPRLGQLDTPPPVGGYAYDGWLSGARAGALALTDGPHVALSATLTFGDAGRRARLLLICPEPVRDALSGPAAQSWASRWSSRVMGAEARISADIATLEVSASSLSALSVGQVLPLPRASIDKIVLRAPGRVAVGEARLGRIGSLRAVRLKGDAPGAQVAVAPGAEAADEGP